MMTKFGLLLFGEASESRTDTGTDLRKKHLTGKPVDDIILSQSNKQSGSAKRIRGKFGENPSQPSLPYLSRKRALKSENLPDRCRKLPGMGSADRTLCLAPSRGARLRFFTGVLLAVPSLSRLFRRIPAERLFCACVHLNDQRAGAPRRKSPDRIFSNRLQPPQDKKKSPEEKYYECHKKRDPA